jgi:outer membrane protein OmpA-like peptidoglycan-associated protein
VPLRRIHMIGLGADQAAEGEAAPASRKDQRRVVVKVWVAPEPALAAASR